MHSYCITLFVSRNGFIGVDKVLPLKTIDIDIMIPIISLPCRYLITYVDSVYLSCSITDSTVHLLEDSFTSAINRGGKGKPQVFVTNSFTCRWGAWRGTVHSIDKRNEYPACGYSSTQVPGYPGIAPKSWSRSSLKAVTVSSPHAQPGKLPAHSACTVSYVCQPAPGAQVRCTCVLQPVTT